MQVPKMYAYWFLHSNSLIEDVKFSKKPSNWVKSTKLKYCTLHLTMQLWSWFIWNFLFYKNKSFNSFSTSLDCSQLDHSDDTTTSRTIFCSFSQLSSNRLSTFKYFVVIAFFCFSSIWYLFSGFYLVSICLCFSSK